jgi:hypothetical protein
MSVFRIVYRQREQDRRRAEDVEAVEFVQKDPWIVFLDPAGTCLTVRSEEIESIERLPMTIPPAVLSAGPPSDPPLPRPIGCPPGAGSLVTP